MRLRGLRGGQRGRCRAGLAHRPPLRIEALLIRLWLEGRERLAPHPVQNDGELLGSAPLVAHFRLRCLPPGASRLICRVPGSGVAARALAVREFALSVACHKAMFFRENDSSGRRINYDAAISGDLRLVPSGHAQEALAEDYASMLAIGMLLDEDESFGTLMERCAKIEVTANAP